MTTINVLLIASITWIVWIPATILEKKTRGDVSRTSIFPIIPVFPICAWGLAYLINLIHPNAGVAIVGGGHVILLVAMLVSIIKSVLIMQRRNRG